MKTPILLIVAVLATVPSVTGAAPTDRQIEESARSSYNFRKFLDDDVKITVNDGVATLTGKVDTEEHRRIAEDTVASIAGVRRVDNQLKIEGGPREGSDDWIATKVRGRLMVKSGVSLKDTDVTVRDGVVTLTGIVESEEQKRVTEAYVRDITGVRGVENRLRVVERPRAPIDESNAPVQAGRQRTNVPDDRAARAQVDRDRAEVSAREPRAEAAAVGGNAEVRTEGREFRDRRDARAVREDRDAGDRIDDGSITAQVKYELFANRSTSGLRTKVDTRDGRVVITGEAATEAEKDLVTKLARSVRGVVAVDNQMTVRR